MSDIRQPTKRYEQLHAGEACRVAGCSRPAEYEVYLYDLYDFLDDAGKPSEFFEQDFTCPFICSTHMEENEHRGVGDRVPRGYVEYPFTNLDGAQGFSRYQPLARLFPELLNLHPTPDQTGLLLAYRDVNDELIRYLAKHPNQLHELDPRKFEELVAAIFRDKGFEVELTPKTRDGGRDVQAVRSTQFGTSLYFIECKRYAPHHKVGVELVRQLYGVVTAHDATRGIIATTSTFSRVAIKDALPLQYRLSLHDFDAIKQWLLDFGSGTPDA